MLGSHKSQYDTIKAFSETDFTEDLKKIDIPVLVLHGDDDQIVPIDAAGRASAKILKNATLKIYPGYPHGMPIITRRPDQRRPARLHQVLSPARASPQQTSVVHPIHREVFRGVG